MNILNRLRAGSEHRGSQHKQGAMADLYVIPELGRTDGALGNGNVLMNGKALKDLDVVFFRFVFLGFDSCVANV